jgi:hypothetical protein
LINFDIKDDSMSFASWPAAEKRGIGAALAVLVVGIFLAYVKIGESATLIALLLVPLVVYGIASGRIQEFSAPGGWAAKFRDAVKEKIDPDPVTQESFFLFTMPSGKSAYFACLGDRR